MPGLIERKIILRKFRKEDLPFINSFVTEYKMDKNNGRETYGITSNNAIIKL